MAREQDARKTKHGEAHDREMPALSPDELQSPPRQYTPGERILSDSEIQAEEDLEPLDLIRACEAVIRTGSLMLSAGTGSYRVKEAMHLVATAIGIDHLNAHVTLTEITVTAYRGKIFRTRVAEVRRLGVNADRIDRLEAFALKLKPGATPDMVDAKLDEVVDRRRKYPIVVNALAAALACSAFAFLNNGGLVECAAVFIAAFAGQFLRANLLKFHLNQFGVTMAASAVASLTYLGIVNTLSVFDISTSNHEAGFISAVLFLIPGFPLVTAALDLAKLDFSAGVARLTYGAMLLLSAGLSIWTISLLVGVNPVPLSPQDIEPVLTWGLRGFASFLGVFGFAIMFNSPMRMALGAGVIGLVANILRLVMIDSTFEAKAATAIAALVVGLLATVVAPRIKVPRITLSVPAVLIMVPGSAAFRTVVYLNSQEAGLALTNGINAVFLTISIAIGLAVARMLTDRDWAFEQ